MLVTPTWLADHLHDPDLVVVDLRWDEQGPGPGWSAIPQEVAAAREQADPVVLDARERSRFRGETVWFETGEIPAGPDGVARTPRGELRAGRIPWARSVPSQQLYRPDLT